MSKLNKYLEQTQSEEVKNWINTVLNNYLKMNLESQGEIEHILDFFREREKYCLSRNKSFNIKKMSYVDAHRLSQEWVEKLNKKAQQIVELDTDTKLEIDFGDGMRLVKLIGENAFKREGNLMSHCVGSYSTRKGINIYSLRDAKNNPHCTMEVNTKDINQIKGKGNGSIHPKYINYIIKSLKHFGKDIRKSEFSYLGYREVSSTMFSFYNSNFKDLKFMSYKGSTFIYNHQKFVRKEG